ncbi:MAG: Tail Collar domain protein [Bacteroidetes bacterium]|nr:Tail Collar domain protein [Bacteroidota bacterium]
MIGSRRLMLVFAACLSLTLVSLSHGLAQNNYLGEIRLFSYNFIPTGWALCQGQLLPIVQNTALFSLIGTTYGGDGQTNFGLPDLRGRAPVSSGQAPGLSDYTLGQQVGEEFHTLTTSEMPAHIHTLNVTNNVGSSDSPQNGVPARNAAAVPQYGTTVNTTAAPATISVAGGSQPHENRPPVLVLNWCIALQGVFPLHPGESPTGNTSK